MTDRLKFALAQLNPVMGDLAGNVALASLKRMAKASGAWCRYACSCLSFLSPGYPPEDLVLRPSFQQAG